VFDDRAVQAEPCCDGADLPGSTSEGTCDMAQASVISVRASIRRAGLRASYLVAAMIAAGFVLPVLPSPASAYESSSGPRVRGLGAVVAPVDRRGPTLPADPFLLPDSGWANGAASGGARGSGGAGSGPYTPTLAQPTPLPVVAPAPPVAAPSAHRPKKTGKSHGKSRSKSHGRIILQKPNG
jgi:hypothetical protein